VSKTIRKTKSVWYVHEATPAKKKWTYNLGCYTTLKAARASFAQAARQGWEQGCHRIVKVTRVNTREVL